MSSKVKLPWLDSHTNFSCLLLFAKNLIYKPSRPGMFAAESDIFYFLSTVLYRTKECAKYHNPKILNKKIKLYTSKASFLKSLSLKPSVDTHATILCFCTSRRVCVILTFFPSLKGINWRECPSPEHDINLTNLHVCLGETFSPCRHSV